MGGSGSCEVRGDALPDTEIFQIRDLDSNTLFNERARVLRLIEEIVPFASVMEVGSTAIEGVIGKQDIDFAVRTPLDRFEETRSVLDRHFQRNANQLSNAEYQGYLVPSPLDIAIQLFVADGKHDHFERFLKLLSAGETLRHAYNASKMSWNGRSMTGYRRAKQAFIDKALSNPQSPP